MGRGRAPCCDKNTVVKGPWSPAEDLKLISYIEKYGHGNWRALPKQAGLLRCGKSCRLRWINYLRPDLKRGNFTAEEERTIIQSHQSLGNKWSRIASRLPGRTDNEIKNYWNTHLKKRLSKAESKQDETSVMTFFSSSSTPFESSPDDETETDSQINLLSLDGNAALTCEMESSKTIIAPIESIMANQVPELQESESFNKLGSSSNQQSGKLLDSSDINQIEEFTLWDDPKEMEFLMSAFEDPDWILALQTTQLGSTGNNSSFELPMDSGSEIWNMLNNGVMPGSAYPVDKEADKVHIVGAPMGEKIINAADEWITDKDIEDMFDYLNSGLAEPSMEMQNKGGDGNHSRPAAASGNEDN